MKSPKIGKAVAIGLVGVGMALVALPGYSAWEQCWTEGGYEDTVVGGTCKLILIAAPPYYDVENQCGPATRIPKGWHCTSGDPYLTCQW